MEVRHDHADVALVKGAAGRKEARDFYELVNSLPSLERLASGHGRIPSRTDFDRKLLSGAIRAVPYEAMALDRGRLAANMARWMKRWEEIRSAAGR